MSKAKCSRIEWCILSDRHSGKCQRPAVVYSGPSTTPDPGQHAPVPEPGTLFAERSPIITPGVAEARGIVVTANETPGVKADKGKARFDLLTMTSALSGVADVLDFGAKKYFPENWRKVPDAKARYYSAAIRHLFAWCRGEKLDPESGLPHLNHALCCLLFLSELENEGKL